MLVKPFRGLRPRADLADAVPSVPYDVVTSGEARRLAGERPHSFLHVIRPEIDLDADIDPHDDRVYRRGRENLQAMIERGWLARDERPSYYAYRLRASGREQTGLVGAAAVSDYLEGRIKKHENTRPDKEADRARLNDALAANPGLIFLMHRRSAALDAATAEALSREAAARFTAEDGVEHALWVVDDGELVRRIAAAFAALPATYVADGHHRTAAAATVSAARVERLGPGGNGEEPCRFFMAAHFPVDELRVLGYHRVVRDLAGMSPDALRARLGDAGFTLRAHPDGLPPAREIFGMFLDGRWELLVPEGAGPPAADVLRRLDVSVLTDRVLEPLLGIGDPRTDPRIDFVGGLDATAELERRVQSGEYRVAFALYPTDLEEVMQVADAGQVMPPKSTWFEPKLRSGLVVQSLDGDRL